MCVHGLGASEECVLALTRIWVPMPLPGGSDMRVNTTVLANIVRVPSPNAYFASAYISGKDSVHAQLLSSTVICM